jgi:heptosyltransferase-2
LLNQLLSTNSSPRILIIGPAWVGDMIMAQVLFKRLREEYPHAVIDVLAPAWTSNLLDRMPEVNQKIMSPFGHGPFALKARYQFGKSLRDRNYDWSIVLQNSWKSALIPFIAKIPRRTGWLGEQRYILLNDARRLDESKYPRMIDRFFALAFNRNTTDLPDNTPYWPRLSSFPEQQTAVQQRLSISMEKPAVVLCPGAEYGPAKRWPTEYFATVASHCINHGKQVWILGSPKDKTLADTIQAQCENRCLDFTGKTSLQEAIDLLAVAEHVVANDSGLMHMACALNRHVVAIYGSTDQAFAPPLHPETVQIALDLQCRPCGKRECPLTHLNCLRLIQPQRVIAHLQITH